MKWIAARPHLTTVQSARFWVHALTKAKHYETAKNKLYRSDPFISRTVPDTFDVMGEAAVPAMVTVNSNSVYTNGTYWQAAVTSNNTTSAVFRKVKVQSGSTTMNRENFVAGSPESFSYDNDGNLLSDGRWTNTWDGENRLIHMETLASVVSNGVPYQKVDFTYDWLGRRTSHKFQELGTNGAWKVLGPFSFVYDGWNVQGAFSNSWPMVTYTWGLDLSGSLQGAGGVGGLLWTTLIGYTPQTHFAMNDGNGNVVGLFDAQSSTLSAQYEYGTFGETLRATGPMAYTNAIRFSSKFTDHDTGLIYYGHRYYSPTLARWISKDPIGEEGGINLYSLIENDALNCVDLLGLILVLDDDCTPEFIKSYNKYLACIECTGSKYSDLINTLKNSRNKYIVRTLGMTGDTGGASGEVKPIYKKTSSGDFQYVGAYISINFEYDFIEEDKESCRGPIESVFFHELWHAYDYELGKGLIDQYLNPKSKIRNSEENAVRAENMFRKDKGITKFKTKYRQNWVDDPFRLPEQSKIQH